MLIQRRKINQIGSILLKKELITLSDLEEALLLQASNGAKIGDVLMGQGKVTAYNFYMALAEHLDLPFINLMKSHPDPLFLEEDERQNYLTLQALPWQMTNKVMVIATSAPTAELHKWATAKYKDYRFVITSPFDVKWMVARFFEKQNIHDSSEALWENDPISSAKSISGSSPMMVFSVIVLSIVCLLAVGDQLWFPLFFVVNIFYMLTLVFKVKFFTSGVLAEARKDNHVLYTGDMKDIDLPIYTILAPMYKEKKVTVLSLVGAIDLLDYPSSKLDVKLIIESDDVDTLNMVMGLKLPSYFDIIRVPVSNPRTKPKACNYALKFAKGEFVTIYDCEDQPSPSQLKKVLKRFKTSDEHLACVQCRLNYFNRDEKMLTKLFSIEYSSWFDFMIQGLEALNIPVPLGGTSNHFKTSTLRELLAWDPYNVTEDADLGIRLAQRGMKTSIVNSITLEEAPITYVAWLKQRSRWLKGYMQTYIVHMRQPVLLYNQLGFRGFFGFMFFVGAPAMVFFTIPFVVVFSALLWSSGQAMPEWFLIVAVTNFASGVAVHMLIALVVIHKNNWWNLWPQIFVFPFYWVLHIMASFKGVYELLIKPHYWDKTEHGMSSYAANTSWQAKYNN
jgi:cellulose synthase/poly-beta-1,6-N-acetylglucosamine synthase-like glycosyltransferase